MESMLFWGFVGVVGLIVVAYQAGFYRGGKYVLREMKQVFPERKN